MHEQIIVLGGSFNPPTIAHLRLLLGAVNALGADKGIFVPSSQGYVKSKMKRAKRLGRILMLVREELREER